MVDVILDVFGIKLSLERLWFVGGFIGVTGLEVGGEEPYTITTMALSNLLVMAFREKEKMEDGNSNMYAYNQCACKEVPSRKSMK